MCRILVTAGLDDKKQFLSASKQFKKLAHFGIVPKAKMKGHKDGWGVAWYDANKNYLKKYTTDAYLDSRFLSLFNKIDSSDLVISHLRKMSVGKISIKNTHPFQINNWSFCHNGTIENSDKIKIKKSLRTRMTGDTDSERFFLGCLSNIDIKNCNAAEFRSGLKKTIKEIRKNSDYYSMCAIFSNGQKLWLVREFDAKNNLIIKGGMEKYLTIFYSTIGVKRGFVVCSQKLNVAGADWVLMKNHQIVEYDLVTKKIKIFAV